MYPEISFDVIFAPGLYYLPLGILVSIVKNQFRQAERLLARAKLWPS